MQALFSLYRDGLALLILRLFLAYEFLEAGLMKYRGNNWFAGINEQFIFPFSYLSAELNWQLAMWAELLVPILLILGIFNRIGALVLMVVTVVAWASVHAGNGYNVCSNGYKMALIYIVMLVPILLQGAGAWSLTQALKKRVKVLRYL